MQSYDGKQRSFIPRGDAPVIGSTGVLSLDSVPKRLPVLCGGIIGQEMATVYDALGARVRSSN